MSEDRRTVIAGSVIVLALMLLVVLGVLALAALLDPIR
jgi:hypothetical protein